MAATLSAADNAGKLDHAWRPLPLIKDGKVDPAWKQIGDDGGLGMLLYAKEKFGNCQIRVVFRPEVPRSNSGVYVRIDDGVVKFIDEKATHGKLSADQMKDASEKEVGAWYPVHRGYEIQISEIGNEYHRTGSVYSLSKAAPLPKIKADGYRTMVITLKGATVHVEVDGKSISDFDSETKELPAQAVVRAEARAEASARRLHRAARSRSR